MDELDKALSELKKLKVSKNTKYQLVLDRIESISELMKRGISLDIIYQSLNNSGLDITIGTFRFYVSQARSEKKINSVSNRLNKKITKTSSVSTSVPVVEPAETVEVVKVVETTDINKDSPVLPGQVESHEIAPAVVSEQAEVSVKTNKSEFLDNLRANDNLLKKEVVKKSAFIQQISDDEL